MAYGLEYTLLCASKKGNLYTAKILEDGYTDPEIDRNIPVNPFKLRKDRSTVVCGTSFEFQIREAVDFEFIKFYTSLPKKYLVEVYKATTLLWTGFLNPNQYRGAYKPVPNNIAFMASDGLGLLKVEDFTLTGTQTELTIIRHCADKIGLGLGYAIAIDIWEVNHDTSLSVLAQNYLDCDIFIDNKCYTVLEKILTKYDAEISQWKGRWQIISSIAKKSTRMLYTSAGVYEGTEAAPTVLNLGYPDEGAEVYPTEILTHSLLPGGNKVFLRHNYGLRESMLKNYLFTKYESLMFTDWTKTGSFSVEQRFIGGIFYAFLRGFADSDDFYIAQNIDITAVTGQDFVFEIDVCPVGCWYAHPNVPYTMNMDVRMEITLTVGATVYYLTATGWSTTPAYYTETIMSSSYIAYIEWTKLSISTFEIPGSGNLNIRLQRFRNAGTGEIRDVSFYGVAFTKPLFYFMNGAELYDDKLEVTATFDDSVELSALENVDLAMADAPDMPNNSLMYDNICRLTGGTPTTTWKRSGDDTAYTLVQLYLRLLASRNRMPRQTLSGNIKGTAIEFNSLIKHAYNNNREFEIASCEWDMYLETFKATLYEVLAFSNEDVSIVDEDGTESSLAGAANLTVISVTPDSFAIAPLTDFNISVHIDNTGEMTGEDTIEWKIVNGADVTQSSGTHSSGSIAAGADDDREIKLTTPAALGTYYVKCKMANDTSWVTSAAIGVHVSLYHIDTIANGVEYDPITASFEAYNSGDAGTDRIYWRLRNSGHTTVASGYQDISFAAGVHTYNLTELTYTSHGSDFDLQIGLSATAFDCTSNHFVIAEAP